jgi:hypothetical protein
MKPPIPLLIACCVVLVGLLGCSSVEKRSQELKLGMSKEAAIDLLGSDYTVVAARLEPDGSPVSVLKFKGSDHNDLYLYFRNDKLAQWGDAEVLKAMPAAARPAP